MSDREIFNKVVILCARDVHKSRTATVRKRIPLITDMTKNLLLMIKDGDEPEDIIFEAARQSGAKPENFDIKLTSWLHAYTNKQWCTMCEERPVRKGNRRFCSTCFSKTSGKESIHTSGGHKICHTGGTGRER